MRQLDSVASSPVRNDDAASASVQGHQDIGQLSSGGHSLIWAVNLVTFPRCPRLALRVARVWRSSGEARPLY